MAHNGRWWIRQQAQAPAYGGGIDLEEAADALERIRPVAFVSEHPLSCFLEDSLAEGVRDEAIFFEAMDRVMQYSDHELFLGRLVAAHGEVLGRQESIELVVANSNLLG